MCNFLREVNRVFEDFSFLFVTSCPPPNPLPRRGSGLRAYSYFSSIKSIKNKPNILVLKFFVKYKVIYLP